MRRRAQIACLLAWTAAGPAQAAAQAALPLQLSWQAPAECPAAADVLAELAEIARVRPGYTLTPLTARAQVTREGGHYVTRLYTEHDGLQGERRLSAEDCRTLVSTVTLVLALAFGKGVEVAAGSGGGTGTGDGTGTGTGTGTGAGAGAGAGAGDGDGDGAGTGDGAGAGTGSDSDSDSESESESESESGSESAGGAAGGVQWAGLVGGGAQLAVLPAAAVAVAAGVEVSTGSVSLGVRATYWPVVSDDVAAGVRARFDGFGGALHGCAHAALAPIGVSLCGFARAAAVRGRSDGAADDGSDTAPWYALGAALGATFPRAGSLRVRAEGGLAVSLDRARFEITGIGPVHRVPLFAPELGLVLLFSP